MVRQLFTKHFFRILYKFLFSDLNLIWHLHKNTLLSLRFTISSIIQAKVWLGGKGEFGFWDRRYIKKRRVLKNITLIFKIWKKFRIFFPSFRFTTTTAEYFFFVFVSPFYFREFFSARKLELGGGFLKCRSRLLGRGWLSLGRCHWRGQSWGQTGSWHEADVEQTERIEKLGRFITSKNFKREIPSSNAISSSTSKKVVCVNIFSR